MDGVQRGLADDLANYGSCFDCGQEEPRLDILGHQSDSGWADGIWN